MQSLSQQKSFVEKYQLYLYCLGFLVFGVANNVGAALMGSPESMQGYPSFLLYATTIIYTLMFLAIALWRKEKPFSKEPNCAMTWAQQKYFLWLAVWTGLNGLFFQFADPWVDGAKQQILVNFQVPFTFLIWWMFGPTPVAPNSPITASDGSSYHDAHPTHKRCHCHCLQLMSLREWVGSLVVVIGIVIGLTPYFRDLSSGGSSDNPYPYDEWYWLVVFIVSVLFNACQLVWQDKAFKDEVLAQSPKTEIKEATCLFYYNLYSLLLYFVTIPMESVAYVNGTKQSQSIGYAFDNQWHAMRCFVGVPFQEDLDSGNCGNTWAAAWVMVFTTGYCGMFFFQAAVISKTNSFWAAVFSAWVQLLALMTFAIKPLVGDYAYQALNWWVAGGFIIIFIGIIVKGAQDEKPKEEHERLQNFPDSSQDEGVTSSPSHAVTVHNGRSDESSSSPSNMRSPLLSAAFNPNYNSND